MRDELELEWKKLGKTMPIAPSMDGNYSVEYEEDVMSLGVNTPHIGILNFGNSPAHTAENTANMDEAQIQILNDKISRLQTLL